MEIINYKPSQDMVPAAANALQRLFGYPGFRPGQEHVVNALLNGQDTLAVMPTGAGKSICYQLPATRPGTLTVVVTPLRALMRDQVQHLAARNIPAALIDGGVPGQERNAIYQAAASGGIRLLYVAPERFRTADFRQFSQQVRIDMVVVDEAHCVLQWGQDFRPDYTGIGGFVASLPHRPVLAAFTATATPEQRDEIIRNLGLHDPFRITTNFDRPNIHLRVVQAKPKMRMEQCALWAKSHEGQAGIIYCESRKRTEAMADRLRQSGISAERFHAQIPEEDKARIQDDFLRNRIQVICATTAFGMGVDKPDVRWVINDSCPASMEEYYQEAGRAGRDGEKADAILMWSPNDFRLMRLRINQDAGSALNDPIMREKARRAALNRLRVMDEYCTSGTCLRHIMLSYFGQSDAAQHCGDCSICNDEPQSFLIEDAAASRRKSGARQSADPQDASTSRPKRAAQRPRNNKPTDAAPRPIMTEDMIDQALEGLAQEQLDLAEREIVRMITDLSARYHEAPAMSTLNGILCGETRDFFIEAGYDKHPDYRRLEGRFTLQQMRAIEARMQTKGAIRINRRRLSLPSDGASDDQAK